MIEEIEKSIEMVQCYLSVCLCSLHNVKVTGRRQFQFQFIFQFREKKKFRFLAQGDR